MTDNTVDTKTYSDALFSSLPYPPAKEGSAAAAGVAIRITITPSATPSNRKLIKNFVAIGITISVKKLNIYTDLSFNTSFTFAEASNDPITIIDRHTVVVDA